MPSISQYATIDLAADADALVIVDASEASAASKTKKVTVAQLISAVLAAHTPDTVTEIYDGSAWPASRPDATHVLAVGGTSAPAWLTAADVWLEDLS